jgi:hypothetical protein
MQDPVEDVTPILAVEPDGTKQWFLKGRLLTEQEIADLQDRPAALIRQKQEEDRQTRSAADIQELLHRKSPRHIRFNR